jgi:hypothetical protein
MNREDIYKKIVDYVREYKGVTFVEIERILKDNDIPVKGEAQFGWLDQNILFWGGMSKEMLDIVEHLIRTKQIYCHPASVLIYLADGRIPAMPIAKKDKKYKESHWLPICFNVTPPVMKEVNNIEK